MCATFAKTAESASARQSSRAGSASLSLLMPLMLHSACRGAVRAHRAYNPSTALRIACTRRPPGKQTVMSSSSLPHAQRTAAEKREADLHHLILSNINQINENIRLLRLQVSPTRLVKARLSITTTFHSELLPVLILDRCSIVPSRPMARCLSPWHPPARWLHRHIYSKRCSMV